MEPTSFAQKIRDNPLRSFCWAMAFFYGVGIILHTMDLFDLRLKFSQMERVWQMWIIFLVIADASTTYLLLKKQKWGEIAFQMMAILQIYVYWKYSDFFGRQDVLVVFHILSLATYWKIRARAKRMEYGDKTRHI